MSGAIHPLPPYAFMAWCLVKAQGNFTLPRCLTNTLGRNPSGETDSLSTGQEILNLLWNPKFHCVVDKSPYPEPFESTSHIHSLFFLHPVCCYYYYNSSSQYLAGVYHKARDVTQVPLMSNSSFY
jgi:hypothetical protein